MCLDLFDAVQECHVDKKQPGLWTLFYITELKYVHTCLVLLYAVTHKL